MAEVTVLQGGKPLLLDAFWGNLRSRPVSFLAGSGMHRAKASKFDFDERLREKLGRTSLEKGTVDDPNLNLLDNGLVVRQRVTESLPADLEDLFFNVGERAFKIVGVGKPGFLRDAITNKEVFTDEMHIGYAFFGAVRDDYHRPILFITGSDDIGILLIERWLTESSFNCVSEPPCFDSEPVEILVFPKTKRPNIDGLLPLHLVTSEIYNGHFRFSAKERLWLTYDRPVPISLTYDVDELSRIDIYTIKETITLTASDSEKWIIFVELIHATEDQKWISIDDILCALGVEKNKGAKHYSSRVHAVHSRLSEFRAWDSRLLLTRSAGGGRNEYSLNAVLKLEN